MRRNERRRRRGRGGGEVSTFVATTTLYPSYRRRELSLSFLAQLINYPLSLPFFIALVNHPFFSRLADK